MLKKYNVKKIEGEIPDYPLEEPFYKKGYYYVSTHNFTMVDNSNNPPFIAIHDVTLRDGEQTPGVTFTEDERVRIGCALNELGVSRIEAGMPIVSEIQFNAIKRMSKMNFKSEIYCFARAHPKDIELAKECGATGIIIEHCVKPHTCKYGYKLTPDTLVKRLVDSIKLAKSYGLRTVFMGWDWFRTPVEFTLWLVDAILNETSFDGLTIVDTVGSTLPEAVENMFRLYHERYPQLELEFHGHNNFSLGVACALAAVNGGAKVIHSAVNGLGEGSGNLATEEIVAALEVLKQINIGVDLSKIDITSTIVSEISKEPIPSNKPIIGSRNFTTESGIATHLLLSMGEKMPDPAMGTIAPKLIGRPGGRNFVLGKNSGKSSIIYFLQKHGITATQEQVEEILDMVKKEAIVTKALVSESTFLYIVDKVLNKNVKA